jgi:hypothetical protein
MSSGEPSTPRALNASTRASRIVSVTGRTAMMTFEEPQPGCPECLQVNIGSKLCQNVRCGLFPAPTPVEQRGLGIVEHGARPTAFDDHCGYLSLSMCMIPAAYNIPGKKRSAHSIQAHAGR